VDNITNFAYVGDGVGTSMNEAFMGYDVYDPGSPADISSGGYMFLRSMKTGLWCRLALYTGPAELIGRRLASSRALRQTDGSATVYGMLADQPTSVTATPFIYSRTGLVYQDTAMVARALFYPLLWSNQTALPGGSEIIVNPTPPGGVR
jgi:hypothetical protein